MSAAKKDDCPTSLLPGAGEGEEIELIQWLLSRFGFSLEEACEMLGCSEEETAACREALRQNGTLL